MNLKTTLESLLKQGDTITLKWDCGGDEALIDIQYNNTLISETPNAPDWVDALYMHLLNTIQLPSAGEFSMDGKGELLLQDQKILLTCTSYWRGYTDYQLREDGDYEEIYIDEDEQADEFTGTFELFSINE